MEVGELAPFPERLAWMAAIALTLGSAFFSAAEAAFLTLDPARLAEMEKQRPRAAALAKNLLEPPGRLMLALTLWSDAINLLAVILIAAIVVSGYRDATAPAWPALGALNPTLLAGAASLALILVFGQVLPKLMGALGGGAFAEFLVWPLWPLAKLPYPLWWAARKLAGAVLRGAGLAPARAKTLEEEDLRELLEVGSRQGVLDATERELLVNLLRSGEITAGDIMTPRHEIVGIPATATEAEAREVVKEEDYSRFPVYEEDLEHIVGVITARDLVKLRLAEDQGLAVRAVMRPPILVPESRRAGDLLRDFKRGRQHLAVVVDEFGAVAGIVTLEDVLEEIFGESNEDDDEAEIENLGPGRWRALGGMEARDFNVATGAKIPALGGQTLAGLCLTRLGRRPRPGDQARVDGFKFTVLEARGIIIHRLEIEREEGS